MTLVDANILLDIFNDDPRWRPLSRRQLANRAEQGPVVINEVIYAELAAGFETQVRLDQSLVALDLTIERLSQPALYQAGRAFRRYRANGGARPNVLADFFIGSQANVEGWPIFTRDTHRFRSYFPEVILLGV